MIPKECKRLAEVDFPIAVVSKHSAREKSTRHGHPSTLHLWWARTVRCETPNCGAEIPLMRSFWLCKKQGRMRSLRYRVVCSKGGQPEVEFEIFEPKNDKEVSPSTITRAKATCLCCNVVLSPDRVRAQLHEQRGGADVVFDKQGKRIGGARLLVVVILKPNTQGRCYRLSTERDNESVWNAMKALEEVNKATIPNGLVVLLSGDLTQWFPLIKRGCNCKSAKGLHHSTRPKFY